MNAHALRVLEFGEALAIVAAHAGSELGRAAVRALTPSEAHGWIVGELRRVDQMLGLLLRAPDWTVPTIPDVRQALRRLGMDGSVLEPAELRDMGELARSAADTRRLTRAHREHFPLIAEIGERLHRFEEEAEAVRRAIDASGGVRDDASRELLRLRRELRGARSRIVEKLERYNASLPSRYQVADASVTVRDGRYVIPIRREGRAEVGGLVHDESATGHTLFVEPPVALELMNRLRELELAEAREVLRVLRELTDRWRPRTAELDETLGGMIEVDSLYARARYALTCNGRRPEMLPPDERTLRVVTGYHPLLLAGGGDVVPFDLEMTAAERTLLVSGPNTGGKTVLLKALGLIALLAQAGVIPPVGAETQLPVFDDVFADIGDEQSIEANLSTFSAHLRNLREVLDHAGTRALVLIDEIGSGTDPAEGGALAQAILLELTRRRALTVATTHLGQLKQLATQHAAVVNASLHFDSVELRPTYRLRKGVPGRSYGLAIARRLGFPSVLLEEAEAFLPGAERDVGHLLEELEQRERTLADAVAEASASRARAQRLENELAERDAKLRAREKDAERRARQQARDLLLQAREEVEATIRELRARGVDGVTDDVVREARRRIEEEAQRHAEVVTRVAPSSPGVPAGGELAVGARVRVAATGAEGVIVELRDGRAVVESGGLRLQMPVASLEPLGAQPARPKPKALTPVWSGPDLDASTEVDLRGLRAEEALGELLPALDAAYQADLRSFRIIHGKGTGALRELVAEQLRGDRRIRTFRPGGIGEGGAGVTVVEFT
jgi:DNA mismatch repair protein MutS2